MQYCLLMHYKEGGELALTEEDMAPARAAFAKYADDLDRAGVLIGFAEGTAAKNPIGTICPLPVGWCARARVDFVV